MLDRLRCNRLCIFLVKIEEMAGRGLHLHPRSACFTNCSLTPFGNKMQITVEANVARGYIDKENILVSMNLHWESFDQLCKS